ncbi:MAG: GNAT family N-acetyltransferase [Acidobacteria bacterium]|nr:GNAT family N-acetyltransferase [Acidobacteriota bacterium]
MNSVEPLCRVLEWDSGFFGFRIARARVSHLTAATAARLLAESEAAALRCLYFLAEADDIETIQLLEAGGFGLKDLRLTLSRPVPAIAIPGAPDIRPATAADLPALRRIARTSHGSSRFYADPNFPRDRCAGLYEAWIANSYDAGFADAVLIGESGGEVAGYITCSMADSARGRIGLFAVDAAARGRGLGRRLIEQSLAWFAAHGAGEAVTVTQGKNLGAVRVYERRGFTAASVQLWYHRWFPTE